MPNPNPNIDLDFIFSYHAPKTSDLSHYNAIRQAGKAFAQVMLDHTPACGDQAAALRKIREAVTTANAAVALGGRLCPEESTSKHFGGALDTVAGLPTGVGQPGRHSRENPTSGSSFRYLPHWTLADVQVPAWNISNATLTGVSNLTARVCNPVQDLSQMNCTIAVNEQATQASVSPAALLPFYSELMRSETQDTPTGFKLQNTPFGGNEDLRSLNAALSERVEALEDGARAVIIAGNLEYARQKAIKELRTVLDSTPTADLAAHDKRVKLEERERCAKLVDHAVKEGGRTYGDVIRAAGTKEDAE